MSEEPQYLDLSGVRPQDEQTALNAALFPALHGISPLNLRILNRASRVIHACKGLDLIRPGEAVAEVYFVHEGRLSQVLANGQAVRLGPGDVGGEGGVLRRRGQPFLLRTQQPCRIHAVELAAVKQVAEADAGFRQRLETLYIRRLLAAFIAAHPLMRGLAASERAILQGIFRTRLYCQGETILSQGAPAIGLHFIIAGRVEIRHANQAGAHVLIEIRRSGELLGELTMSGGKIAYDAVATGDVDVLLLQAAQWREIGQRLPNLQRALRQQVSALAAKTAARVKACLGSLAQTGP